jgi:hypothetical protein
MVSIPIFDLKDHEIIWKSELLVQVV